MYIRSFQSRLPMLLVPLLAVFVLIAAACEEEPDPPDEPAPATPTPVDTPEPTPTPENGQPAPATGPDPANGLLEAETFEVIVRDFEFEPSEITVPSGELIEIVVINEGAETHTLTIDEIDADIEVTTHEAIAMDADLSVEVGAGMSGAARLEGHEAGAYDFYCAVPGHAEQGMRGTLIIE